MEERINVLKETLAKAFDISFVNMIIDKLKDLNFFEAPASTKYHGNYAGGLFDHSFSVMNHLVKLTKDLGLTWERPESPYIVGLFHDLCKCDQYKWDADKNAYVYAQTLLNGHGEKSIIIAQNILQLTEEEILCIRWHMGAFDEKENWNLYGGAIEQYPNVLWTHTADMIAARIDQT